VICGQPWVSGGIHSSRRRLLSRPLSLPPQAAAVFCGWVLPLISAADPCSCQLIANSCLPSMNDPGNLAVIRESPNAALREHQVPVDRDFENTVFTLDQLDSIPELRLQLGRQPGGPRPVVSDSAVFD
jgi:hypothetical protein